MKEDNENNAIVACRFLLDIIKSWHPHLKIEENFGKLFEFLEEKVSGLLGFIRNHLNSNTKSDIKKSHSAESMMLPVSGGSLGLSKNSEAIKVNSTIVSSQGI